MSTSVERLKQREIKVNPLYSQLSFRLTQKSSTTSSHLMQQKSKYQKLRQSIQRAKEEMLA